MLITCNFQFILRLKDVLIMIYIIMDFTLKTATLNTSNMDTNHLHITLNNTIKNKMYNIKPQKILWIFPMIQHVPIHWI